MTAADSEDEASDTGARVAANGASQYLCSFRNWEMKSAKLPALMVECTSWCLEFRWSIIIEKSLQLDRLAWKVLEDSVRLYSYALWIMSLR